MSADVTVDTVRVRPVGLDCYCIEPLLDDQPFRDLGALVIKVVGAVGGFSQQDQACFANSVEERAVIAFGVVQSVGAVAKISGDHAFLSSNE